MLAQFLRALCTKISQAVLVGKRFLHQIGCKERKGWEKQHTQIPKGLKSTAVTEL